MVLLLMRRVGTPPEQPMIRLTAFKLVSYKLYALKLRTSKL